MLKYIKRIEFSNKDNRTTEEKVKELKKIGVNVSVRGKNDEYKEGYIFGRISVQR